MMAKGSSLNPLASTFIPSSVTGVVTEAEDLNSDPKAFATKSIVINIASNFTHIVMQRKKERGVCISKRELLDFVLRLISFKHNISSIDGFKRAKDYLSKRIPRELSIKVNGESSTGFRKFDLSVCSIPAPTILLVAFYGLYRHEQAFRPLLSLAHRPKAFQDEVWSLTDEDLKLWNPSVAQPCSCPPMFGYHIPADFFGNPFKFSNPCSKKKIHLCRSKESSKGNEYILLERARSDQRSEIEFVDFEEKLDLDPKSNLDYYSKQMEEIVKSVCSLINDYDTAEHGTKHVTEDVSDEGYVSELLDSLWNTKDSESSTIKKDELTGDDHPLLNDRHDAEDLDGEVPMEVKELLRKCFSNELDTESAPSSCDPPCSVWCSKLESSNSIHNERKSDSAIDLFNETTRFLTDISSGSETQDSKPSFKRSFSANDSDRNYTWLPQSRIKSDNYNSRRDSSDSGIALSQEEDIPCEDESDEGTNDRAPMWTLFSGEHSLWQPLPASLQSKSAYKRARDLKRQTSLVN